VLRAKMSSGLLVRKPLGAATQIRPSGSTCPTVRRGYLDKSLARVHNRSRSTPRRGVWPGAQARGGENEQAANRSRHVVINVMPSLMADSTRIRADTEAARFRPAGGPLGSSELVRIQWCLTLGT